MKLRRLKLFVGRGAPFSSVSVVVILTPLNSVFIHLKCEFCRHDRCFVFLILIPSLFLSFHVYALCFYLALLIGRMLNCLNHFGGDGQSLDRFQLDGRKTRAHESLSRVRSCLTRRRTNNDLGGVLGRVYCVCGLGLEVVVGERAILGEVIRVSLEF